MNDDDALLYQSRPAPRHIVATCSGSRTFRSFGSSSCWHVVCATCQQQIGADRGPDWFSHEGAVARLARHLRDVHGVAL